MKEKFLKSFLLGALFMPLTTIDAASLITNGQTIDVGGVTATLDPTAPDNTSGSVTHNGGGNYTIATNPPNNDFWIAFTSANLDPDRFNYLQIDFTSMTLADSGVFQLYIADAGFGGGDLSFNAPVTTSTSNFSLVFELTGSPTWDALKNSNPNTGSTIDGVRLDTFNSTNFRSESFTITGITFGDTLLPAPVPEPSSWLLAMVGLLPLLHRRRKI